MHVQFKSGALEQNIAESLDSTCPFGSLKFYHRICMHALKRQSLKPCKYSQVSSIRTDIVRTESIQSKLWKTPFHMGC